MIGLMIRSRSLHVDTKNKATEEGGEEKKPYMKETQENFKFVSRTRQTQREDNKYLTLSSPVP